MTIRFLNFTSVTTSSGAPTGAAEDGALVVDTTNDVLYIRSGGAWVLAGGGGGGSDFFAANYTGAPSTALGSESVAVGGNATAGGDTAVAIGETATASGNDSIAIGDDTTASNTDAIAIGDGATCDASDGCAIGEGSFVGLNSDRALAIGDGANVVAGSIEAICLGNNTTVQTLSPGSIAMGTNVNVNGSSSIAIGDDADVSGARAISIGNDSFADGNEGIAIGDAAQVQLSATASIAIGDAAQVNPGFTNSIALGTSANVAANSAVQIGTGTNSTASTLQFLGNTIADASGIVGGGGGEDYVTINSAGTLPTATGTNAISIGPESTAGNQCISIGVDAGASGGSAICIGAETLGIGADSIAIGRNANSANAAGVCIGEGSSVTGNFSSAIGISANASGVSCVQLGGGTNSTDTTLQFRSTTIANDDGLQATVRNATGAPTTTPADGSLVVNNVDDTFYIRSGSNWVEVGSGGGGSPLTTKGDIFTFDTADARLPVGTDGQILVANSATATGLEWQTTSSEVLAGGFSTPIGNGALTSITVNHGLGTRNLHVTVYRNSSPYDEIVCDIEHTDENNVELGFTVAPTLDEFICYVSIGGGREVLTANRTYYVATTGSDSNDGLTVGNPFLTIQKAIDVVAGLDISTYDVDIQLADGTYNISTTIQLKTIIGAGQVFIKGNNGTPANVVLNGSVDVIRGCYTGDYKLQDFTIQTSLGNCIYIFGCKASTVRIENLRFGTCTSVHMALEDGPIGFVEGDYEIFGGATYHLYALTHSSWNYTRDGGVRTMTLTGTPNFSGAFAIASRLGEMTFTSTNAVWSGSATGQRYTVALNGVIDSNGAGATYLPGNSAGSSTTGGQYA